MDWKMMVFSPPPGLELLGILDSVDSAIFEEWAFDSGSFSLTIVLDDNTRNLCQPGNIVWLEGDTAGVIEYFSDEATEEENTTVAKGKVLTGILANRILWGLHNYNASPTKIMRDAVLINAVEPTMGDAENRQIPGLVLADEEADGRKIRIQAAGDNLLEFNTEIGTANQTAFGVRFNPEIPQMEFWTRRGTDRTVDQIAVNPVLFSTALDDVLRSSYEYNSGDYANVALVAGEGTGTDRKNVTVYGDEFTVGEHTDSGGGSGNGSDSAGFTVRISTSTGGTAAANKVSGLKEGDAVTLFISPQTGYELDKLSVFTEAGDTISIVDDNTFTMPNGNAVVAITFSASGSGDGGGGAEERTAFNLAVGTNGHGAVSASKTREIAPGEAVTLEITPADGYELETLTGVRLSGGSVAVNTYGFIMPADDVAIFVSFSAAAPLRSIVTATDGNGDISVSKSADIAPGETISITIAPGENYQLESLTATTTTGATVPISGNSLVMPDADVAIFASFSAVPVEETYRVVGDTDGNGELSIAKTEGIQSGENVAVSAAPNAGYSLKKLSAKNLNGATVPVTNGVIRVSDDTAIFAAFNPLRQVATATDGHGSITVSKSSGIPPGETIFITTTPATDYQLKSLSAVATTGKTVSITGGYFTMPDADVAVFATFYQDVTPTYKIVTGSDAYGTVSVSKRSDIVQGETITVTYTPITDYKLESLIVRTMSGKSVALANGNQFVMPDDDVMVFATFEPIHVVTPDETYGVYVQQPIQHGTVSLSKSNGILPGETITVTLLPDAGYEGNGITVLDANGNQVATSSSSFIMPSSNVYLTANSFTIIPNRDLPDTYAELQYVKIGASKSNGTFILPELYIDAPSDGTIEFIISMDTRPSSGDTFALITSNQRAPLFFQFGANKTQISLFASWATPYSTDTLAQVNLTIEHSLDTKLYASLVLSDKTYLYLKEKSGRNSFSVIGETSTSRILPGTVSAFSNTYSYIKTSSTYGNAAKIHGIRFFDLNGVCVKNFIPCKIASGTAGFYESVGDQFYTSVTSTDIVAGPEGASGYYEDGTGNLNTTSASAATLSTTTLSAAPVARKSAIRAASVIAPLSVQADTEETQNTERDNATKQSVTQHVVAMPIQRTVALASEEVPEQSVEARVPSGFGRKEIYVDARDLQSDSDPENPLTDDEYYETLFQRGKEKLAEHQIVQTFDASIRTRNPTYKYKEDYFLGDTVTVIDERLGITLNAIVEAVSCSIAGSNEDMILTLGYSQPTINDLLRRKVDK